MRDAFGGVFMIRLLLVFIVIYVAFAAISFNYAKAFKIKNRIIDYVEQNEIIDLNNFFVKGNGKNLSELDEILDSANYNKECKNSNGIIDNGAGEADSYCYRGIVITPKNRTDKYIEYEIYNLDQLNIQPNDVEIKEETKDLN